MPTTIADATVHDADQRAKASPLRARVEALKHKLGDARSKLDLRAQITQHPLPAVGIAFALGILAGLARARPTAPDRSLKSAAFTALGLRILRDLALGQVGYLAKQWWLGEQPRPTERPGARRPAAS